MPLRYKQIEDGEWLQPGHKYKLMCCDCHLVHTVNFRVRADGQVEFLLVRDRGATAAARRPFRFPPDNADSD